MECRPGCGACCIAPSITSPIPGMQGGKPAGVRCIHLGDDRRCRIFGMDDRPAVCRDLRPSAGMCGDNLNDALSRLAILEETTRPA
ncbi:MAG: YkgJ family cysteine cluster protein [Chrysiogenales bacterium]|nr:MAG: YkgJ family cysteine cluster protein [Chrysiogenales bacterium]